MVGGRLDKRNSLYRSFSALDLCKLQCVQNSLARIVTNTTRYWHITPIRKTLHWLPIEHHSIFKATLQVYKFLNRGYPKYFAPFLIPRHSFITHVKAKLMVCPLSPSFCPFQYISPLCILASALLLLLQRFGRICLMMYIQPLLSTHSERSSKPISLHKHIHPNFFFSRFLSMVPTLANYSSLFLGGLVHLESAFRWRLSTIKILLELEY